MFAPLLEVSMLLAQLQEWQQPARVKYGKLHQGSQAVNVLVHAKHGMYSLSFMSGTEGCQELALHCLFLFFERDVSLCAGADKWYAFYAVIPCA